jgi:hypothetical protein
MTDAVKVALIAAGTIIAAVSIFIYFSPYQTCVRSAEHSLGDTYQDPANAARVLCAKNSN